MGYEFFGCAGFADLYIIFTSQRSLPVQITARCKLPGRTLLFKTVMLLLMPVANEVGGDDWMMCA
jgi:hypothetical protein